MRTITPVVTDKLFDQDGNECFAVLLGKDAADSMANLTALKSEPLAALSEASPKIVSSLRVKSAEQHIARADGAVLKFSFGAPQPRHTMKDAGQKIVVL